MSTVAVVNKETGEVIGDAKLKDDNRQNSDFVMLYRRCLEQFADLSLKDPRAMQIFMFLVKNMDNSNAIGVTMELMSKMLGLSRQTISSKIKYLQEHGWLEVFKLGKSNIYVLNPEVVWSSYAKQKQYCLFDARIMLDPSDNNFEIPKNKRGKYKFGGDVERMAINNLLDTLEAETGGEQ